jgi:Ser/Thr protein kinase RdoA (MazF antagonist)
MMNPTNLCEIVRDLAHALELLASNDIVHADLRLDNVVVKTEDYGDGEAVEETHLVDFSSAFRYYRLFILIFLVC